MELRLLRYFVVLAEELHYRRAAERLHIAQPSLSVQIRKLEKDVGVPLFDRQGSRVALSPAGAALLEQARGILAQADHFAATAKQHQAAAEQPLAIALVDYARPRVLPHLLDALHRRWPAVSVTLRAAIDSAEALADLRRGHVDLGVVRGPVDLPWTGSLTLAREPFWAALPSGHPLAATSDPVTIPELAEHPFALFGRATNPTAFDHIAGTFAAAGATLRIRQESRRMDDSLMFVAAGSGLGMFPESVALTHQDPKISWRPIAGQAPEVTVELVWQGRSMHPVVRGIPDELPPLLARAAPAAIPLD